jgi:DNA-binding NarL/FixJ family response regulator
MGQTPDPRARGGACSRTRIVIVDDHAIVRQGLASILQLEKDFDVVGEASSVEAALVVMERKRPDLVLVDLKLNNNEPPDGFVLCSEITRRYPDVGVVVLTTFVDEGLVEEAIKRGARGYALKDVDVMELARIMRAVLRGGSGFDGQSAAAMARAVISGTSPKSPQLTARHVEIVRLMSKGFSNREIGAQLYLSPSTVKFHVRNIMQRLGARHRAEVVYKATQNHLL